MKIANILAFAACIAFAVSSARPALATDFVGAQVALQGLPSAAATKFVEVAATADTLKSLRDGGYALYLRHGPTNNAIADRVPTVDLNDCSTQRPLTEAGRQLLIFS